MVSDSGVGRGEALEGVVLGALPNALYEVAAPDGRRLLVHLADRLRVSVPRIVPGDTVRVQVSPYDQGRGRIVAHRRSLRA